MTTRNNNTTRQTRNANANATQETTQETTQEATQEARENKVYNVLITSVAKNTFSNKVTVGINVAIPSFDKEGSENEVKYFNINAVRLLKECAEVDTDCAAIYGMTGDFKKVKSNILAWLLVGKKATIEREYHEEGEIIDEDTNERLNNTGYKTIIKDIKGNINQMYLPLLQKALIEGNIEEKTEITTASIFDAMNV